MNNGEEKIRVLDEVNGEFLVIDFKGAKMPYWKKSLEGFKEEEEQEKVFDSLPLNERKEALNKYTMIASILPVVSNEKERTKRIQEVSTREGITCKTVRKYLRLYLASNDIGSLAFHKEKQQKELTKDEKNMRKALNKYYFTQRKNSLKNAYTMMLKDFYCDKDGKLLEKYPSENQFRYFYRKRCDSKKEIISRNGINDFMKNHRMLVGDGVQQFAPTIGCGFLDSTICDIYLVDDRGNIVGRPLLCACVDAYSGLLMGYSLGWEGGVYSLRNMLLNVITNKVEHCKKFGIEIDDKVWSCQELPLRIVTDKGSEYKSQNLEQLSDLGVTIENLPPYRPDLKSKVEKFFDVVQNYYIPTLKGKGVIQEDFGERGAIDYRKEACLTLEDFEKVLIYCFIHYNSKRIVDFPFDEKMLEEKVKPHSCDIWEYAKKQEGACIIKVGREDLVYTLLPRTRVKLSRRGLVVNGMRYYNPKYEKECLDGKSVIVAYNVDDSSYVWLLENGKYIPFELIESRYKGKTIAKVKEMQETKKMLLRGEEEATIQAQIELVENISTIVNVAKRENKGIVKNIRETRTRETRSNHKDIMKEVKDDV